MYYNFPLLKQRVVRSHPKPVLHRGFDNLPLRSGPCKLWDDESMQKAIAAVEQGTDSIRRAAEKYGIPRSTLHDHVSGKVDLRAKPGRDPYLSLEEEEELVSFLLKCAHIGYPHTRKQVMTLVQEFVNDKGINTVISEGWWERFKQRHSKLFTACCCPVVLR